MVVSSGFLDHAAEVYLRANGLIMSTQTPITSLNRIGTEWPQQQSIQPQSQPIQQQQQQPQQQTQLQQPQVNQTNMQTNSIKTNNGQPSPARAILICHSNSHPFQTRNILLEPRQEVKVGRSVPRSRVEDSNAIFDCKVLSRNHAIIWFVDGKFYIKDTGSSNGTFINSQRIKSSEPYEILSGDIVQFGVDVTENSRKETHGCIIAVLKLITPDGFEKTSYQQQISPSIIDNDIFRLKRIMHESYLRELVLEEKLLNLQKEVLTTRTNSSNTWQAMIHEDLLLSRIDILENKLLCYQKNITNEKLQDEVVKLQDDKSSYQKAAKEALKKVYQDRMAVIQKFTKFEQLWQSSEDELVLLRSQLIASNENNEKLSQEVNNVNAESIRAHDFDCKTIKESFETAKRENDELKNRLQLIENINDNELMLANEESASDSNKNITMWNKQAILHWLNPDLKQARESDDIKNPKCNDLNNKDYWKIDPEKCSQLYDKLLDIEKKLSLTDNKANEESITEAATIKSDESVSTISDGNQNNENNENNDDVSKDGNQNKQENNDDDDDDVDVTTFRNVIGELKEIYNEFLSQIKLMQKDLTRAAKYDELESKLISTMLELQLVQKQQRKVRSNCLNDITNQNNEANIDDMASSTAASNEFVAVALDSMIKQNVNVNGQHFDEPSDEENILLLRQQNNNNITDHNQSLCDTISTADTYNSSTNSIITDTNSQDLDDFTEQNFSSNLSHDNSFDTQIDCTENLNISNGSDDLHTNKWCNDNNKIIDNIDERIPVRIPCDTELSSVSKPIELSHNTTTDKNTDYDYDEEKAALESFDRIIEDECKLINETDILREEELVELKERCVKLTDDNITLRKEVESLRLNSSKQLAMLMYTAPLAVIIGYLFSLIFS